MLLMQQARDRAAGSTPRASSPAIAARRSAGSTRTWCGPRRSWIRPASCSSPASTRNWPPPRSGARSRPRCEARAATTACSASGTARARASTARRRRLSPRQHGRHLAPWRRAGADGDDHTAESSTVAHQSEFHFVDVMSPILNPAGVQEILDYGLYGYAMSRYCGTWVAFKCVKENIESTASVDARLDRVKIVLPDDFLMPPGGLNIRTPDGILEQEARLQDFKRDAMLAFVRANNLNRLVLSAGASRRSESSPSASPISTCARRWTTSASTRSRPTTWGCGSTRSPAPGLCRGASWLPSPTASTSSWWWRRSAR